MQGSSVGIDVSIASCRLGEKPSPSLCQVLEATHMPWHMSLNTFKLALIGQVLLTSNESYADCPATCFQCKRFVSLVVCLCESVGSNVHTRVQTAKTPHVVPALSLNTMMNVGMNRLGAIGHLVTRAALNSGKVDNVAINDPFIDLNYMVYIFQCDFTQGKFHSTAKTENGKLVINGKAISIFQEQDPSNIKCVMLVLSRQDLT
ncbi:hypothetical protein STEG23_026963 [Scotinomys teguina]